ncbi:MAG: hypothetical protein ACE5QV_05870 [Fidelibacterota bacterium]
MSIICSGCGKEYDHTLFQFGRKIICECGEVIDAEKPKIKKERDGGDGDQGNNGKKHFK